MLPQVIKGKYKGIAPFVLNELLLYIYNIEDISRLAFIEDFSDEKQIFLESLINEYKNGKPLEYITGRCNFYGLDFIVNKNVLIPRIETELLVQMAVDIIGDRECSIVDLCTGSGIIAISVAMKCKNVKVLAVDISKDALLVCEENIKKYNLQNRITTMQCDILNDIPIGKFDAVISNPPYIESGVITTLQNNVKDFEPHIALDGGNDGMVFYRKFREYFQENCLYLFEIGYNQKEDLKELYKNIDCDIIKDWNGNDRVLKIGKFKGGGSDGT